MPAVNDVIDDDDDVVRDEDDDDSQCSTSLSPYYSDVTQRRHAFSRASTALQQSAVYFTKIILMR